MQFGRYYEEFEVGAVYKHWPGKTVTEYDDHLFCLLTMNHHPLHMDAHYAEETTDFGRNVVVGNYVYSLLLGMSVPDVSGKAIANLEVESLKHTRPTFHGDTIYGETEVLDKTESRSKDDRGVVHVETRGYKQDGTVVCTFRRKVMVPKRSYGDSRGGEQPGRPVPRVSPALAGECVPLPQGVVQQGDQRQARQRGGVAPAGVGGVVARAQRAADDRAPVVGDQVGPAAHRADQRAGLDDQPGLLGHLPHHGFDVRLARLDPAAGNRPQPASGIVAAADQQQPVVGVVRERTHAGDTGVTLGHRIATFGPARRIPPIRSVRYKSRVKGPSPGAERWLSVNLRRIVGFLLVALPHLLHPHAAGRGRQHPVEHPRYPAHVGDQLRHVHQLVR